MIYSMTAFGRAQQEIPAYSVTVEIRTLNGRNLDVVLRLPKNYLEFEKDFRKQITERIRRGRVEVYVQVETTIAEQKTPQLNMSLSRFYWEQLQHLHRLLPGSDPPKLENLLAVPYLFESVEAPADQDLLREVLFATLAAALEQINLMRMQEGEALQQDCLARLNTLREELAMIYSRKDLIVEEYQTRLRERLQELLTDVEIDANRLAQEVAYLAERSDINEEIVRLESHLVQMEEMLKGPGAAEGRRLDFLTQEMHREVNTIGCKTGDLQSIQCVLRMKGEIGKLKEQIQNVE